MINRFCCFDGPNVPCSFCDLRSTRNKGQGIVRINQLNFTVELSYSIQSVKSSFPLRWKEVMCFYCTICNVNLHLSKSNMPIATMPVYLTTGPFCQKFVFSTKSPMFPNFKMQCFKQVEGITNAQIRFFK